MLYPQPQPSFCPVNEVYRQCKGCELECGEDESVSTRNLTLSQICSRTSNVFKIIFLKCFLNNQTGEGNCKWKCHVTKKKKASESVEKSVYTFQKPCAAICIPGCTCDPTRYRRYNGQCIRKESCPVSCLLWGIASVQLSAKFIKVAIFFLEVSHDFLKNLMLGEERGSGGAGSDSSHLKILLAHYLPLRHLCATLTALIL